MKIEIDNKDFELIRKQLSLINCEYPEICFIREDVPLPMNIDDCYLQRNDDVDDCAGQCVSDFENGYCSNEDRENCPHRCTHDCKECGVDVYNTEKVRRVHLSRKQAEEELEARSYDYGKKCYSFTYPIDSYYGEGRAFFSALARIFKPTQNREDVK